MNVYILLDRTGSMADKWIESVSSINAYVRDLKKSAKTKVYVATFDAQSYDVLRETTTKAYVDIETNESHPRSWTNLYDSFAKLVEQANKDNAKKTIIITMTDGEENASKEHTLASTRALVKMIEEKKWVVMFLGAGFKEVEAAGASLGINPKYTFNNTVANLGDTMRGLATKSSLYAASGAVETMAYSDEEKKLAVK